MRSTGDRLRHVTLFEIIGLALVTPLGVWAFDRPYVEIGAVAIGSSVVATAWNYGYNLAFDTVLMRLRGTTWKTVPLRIFHACLFEAGLIVVLMPLIAWYLGISLWHALVMDAGFAAFYVVYAFVFNWIYDVVFPIPDEPAPARR